jgi:hypothetical protein
VTPIKHFEAVWTRCAELSALHAYLANRVSAVLHPDELLRSEWVARLSALDLYVHELVAQRMLAIFEGRLPPTPAYLRFQVPTETLDRIRGAPSSLEASAGFDLEVRSQLSRNTFQHPDNIADAVRLCCGVELWNEVAIRLGATPQNKITIAKGLRRDLSLIVERRNKIAHEGDLQPTISREPWPISQADVAFVANHIEKIVRAIDDVV